VLIGATDRRHRRLLMDVDGCATRIQDFHHSAPDVR
jgi:hypothetical protein